MVQIVENWADVRGRVEAVERAPADGAPLALQLRVEAVAAVTGFPNLLADVVGQLISVRGPELARTPHVGEHVRCRVRKAGLHRFFFRPDSVVID